MTETGKTCKAAAWMVLQKLQLFEVSNLHLELQIELI
jgi:hypothetical protein